MSTEALEVALHQCSLHELELILSRILARSGFGDVQILDRRESRQKSRYGGFEMLCEGTFGSLRLRLLVKVLAGDSFRQRMLSEMAGTVLLRKADAGLVVATGCISQKHRELLPGYLPAARVEVVDGPALARLLIEHRIGVRGDCDVDYSYFGGLEIASFRILSFLAEIK